MESKEGPLRKAPCLLFTACDEDFMETYKFELATPESRFLSEEFGSDTSVCLVNEAAVRKYKLEDPLNQVLVAPDVDGFHSELRIIGVVKDHHFSSVKQEITAQIIRLKSEESGGYITLRLAEWKREH